MTTGKKCFYTLLVLLEILALIPALWWGWNHSLLPHHELTVALSPQWEAYLATALLGLSGLLIVTGIILLLSLPLLEKRKAELKWSKSSGRLLVSKAAIGHFIKEKCTSEDYLSHPQVKVQLYAHKIKVDVKGHTAQRANLKEEMRRLEQSLASELQCFLGVDQRLKLKVRVTDTTQTEQSKKQRVV